MCDISREYFVLQQQQPITNLSPNLSVSGGGSSSSTSGGSTFPLDPRVIWDALASSLKHINFNNGLFLAPALNLTDSQSKSSHELKAIYPAQLKPWTVQQLAPMAKLISILPFETELVKKQSLLLTMTSSLLTLPHIKEIAMTDALTGTLAAAISPDLEHPTVCPIFNVTSTDLTSFLRNTPDSMYDEFNRDGFPFTRKQFGIEVYSDGRMGVHVAPEILLLLLRRQLFQQILFLYILQACRQIQTYATGFATDPANAGKVSPRVYDLIQSVTLAYQTEAQCTEAMSCTKGSASEPNTPCVRLAHFLFPGLSCGSNLLSKLNVAITRQAGEFFIKNIQRYYDAYAHYYFGNFSLSHKWNQMRILSDQLATIETYKHSSPALYGLQAYTAHHRSLAAIGHHNNIARDLLIILISQVQMTAFGEQLRNCLASRASVIEDLISAPLSFTDTILADYLTAMISELELGGIKTHDVNQPPTYQAYPIPPHDPFTTSSGAALALYAGASSKFSNAQAKPKKGGGGTAGGGGGGGGGTAGGGKKKKGGDPNNQGGGTSSAASPLLDPAAAQAKTLEAYNSFAQQAVAHLTSPSRNGTVNAHTFVLYMAKQVQKASSKPIFAFTQTPEAVAVPLSLLGKTTWFKPGGKHVSPETLGGIIFIRHLLGVPGDNPLMVLPEALKFIGTDKSIQNIKATLQKEIQG